MTDTDKTIIQPSVTKLLIKTLEENMRSYADKTMSVGEYLADTPPFAKAYFVNEHGGFTSADKEWLEAHKDEMGTFFYECESDGYDPETHEQYWYEKLSFIVGEFK